MKNSTFGPAKKTFYILCCVEGYGKTRASATDRTCAAVAWIISEKVCVEMHRLFLHKQGGDALFCFDAMQWFGLIYWFRSGRLAD